MDVFSNSSPYCQTNKNITPSSHTKQKQKQNTKVTKKIMFFFFLRIKKEYNWSTTIRIRDIKIIL